MKDDKRTRLLEDLDTVRQRITELEESEKERVDSEKALREDSERYRHAVDTAPLGVLSVDVQGKIRYANSLLQKKFKLDAAEQLSEINVMAHPAFSQAGLDDAVRRCLQTQKQNVVEQAMQDQNGHKSWFRSFLNPIFDKDGSINGVLAVLDDVSEQKKMQEQITQRLAVEENTTRVMSKLVGNFDIEGAVNSTLAELGKIHGADRAFLFLFYSEGAKMDNTHEWCAGGVKPQMESMQNLSTSDFSWLMKQLSSGKPVLVKDAADLTAEAKKEQSWMAQMGSQSLVALPVQVSGTMTGFLGMTAAEANNEKWPDEEAQLLKSVAGVVGDYLEQKREDDMQRMRDERCRRLAQASVEGLFILKDGVILDSNHVAGGMLGIKPSDYQGNEFIGFVAEKDRSPVQKLVAAPNNVPFETAVYKKDSKLLPVEIQVRSVLYQDNPMTVVAMRDISQRTEQAASSEEKLQTAQQALDGAIHALSLSVALRDPFAAGHGEGVATLAAAIAEEMGMAREKIEGLRLTGTIHDIGKIGLPAEILSKPGKISDAERMLVENHPQIGYQILKEIKFPWPVAQIVLQHHERMNGTGYPAGLSGDNILPEARILAVADIIDAMTSDRSYRPARGLENAVEEITRNKGTLYDPKVVEAAVKVLDRKGYPLT
jgi:PAS domain S-box-containing protein/putative nucleotidyltransferase with HDIG domain